MILGRISPGSASNVLGSVRPPITEFNIDLKSGLATDNPSHCARIDGQRVIEAILREEGSVSANIRWLLVRLAIETNCICVSEFISWNAANICNFEPESAIWLNCNFNDADIRTMRSAVNLLGNPSRSVCCLCKLVCKPDIHESGNGRK